MSPARSAAHAAYDAMMRELLQRASQRIAGRQEAAVKEELAKELPIREVADR